MPWYAWLIVSLLVISSLLLVANIGKPRKPLAPEVAAITVFLNALIIWGIVSLAVRA